VLVSGTHCTIDKLREIEGLHREMVFTTLSFYFMLNFILIKTATHFVYDCDALTLLRLQVEARTTSTAAEQARNLIRRLLQLSKRFNLDHA